MSTSIISKATDDQQRQIKRLGEDSGRRAAKLALKKVPLNKDEWQWVIRRWNEMNQAVAELVIAKVHELSFDNILRPIPFNPVEFCGQGWDYAEPQDKRSLCFAVIDETTINFSTFLKKGENAISGEERLKRAKESSCVRLDARFFMALWKEEGHKTLEWFYTTHGVSWIEFLGSPLRRPDGDRDTLVLDRFGGRWRWHSRCLNIARHAGDFVAVLAS